MKIVTIMFVLNEEEFVEYTVPNAAEHSDEVLVIDTGCTDKTMDIITNLNLNNVLLYSYKQNNDRYKWMEEEVRNYGEKLALDRGADYTFIQDADELIECNLHKIASTGMPYYCFKFIDVVFRKYVKGFGVHKHVRLFKTGKISWINKIHPSMAYEGKIIREIINLIEDTYFFHLHRYNNLPKQDEDRLYKPIWKNEGLLDIQGKIKIPECLIKFWEAKGI